MSSSARTKKSGERRKFPVLDPHGVAAASVAPKKSPSKSSAPKSKATPRSGSAAASASAAADLADVEEDARMNAELIRLLEAANEREAAEKAAIARAIGKINSSLTTVRAISVANAKFASFRENTLNGVILKQTWTLTLAAKKDLITEFLNQLYSNIFRSDPTPSQRTTLIEIDAYRKLVLTIEESKYEEYINKLTDYLQTYPLNKYTKIQRIYIGSVSGKLRKETVERGELHSYYMELWAGIRLSPIMKAKYGEVPKSGGRRKTQKRKI